MAEEKDLVPGCSFPSRFPGILDFPGFGLAAGGTVASHSRLPSRAGCWKPPVRFLRQNGESLPRSEFINCIETSDFA